MDEKIIKKNAVPVIAAMITALAFSFTGLPMWMEILLQKK